MRGVVALVGAAGLCTGAVAQTFEVSLVAPRAVDPGTTYTMEVWGSWSGIDEGPDGAALAGFNLSILASEGSASVTTATINPDLTLGSDEGRAVGRNLRDVVGGQLANLFGELNPGINLSNPIRLFTFDVTPIDGFDRRMVYHAAVGRDGANPALAVYPNSTNGPSTNSDTPGATLILGTATTIVPAPAGLALLSLGALAATRRRR